MKALPVKSFVYKLNVILTLMRYSGLVSIRGINPIIVERIGVLLACNIYICYKSSIKTFEEEAFKVPTLA